MLQYVKGKIQDIKMFFGKMKKKPVKHIGHRRVLCPTCHSFVSRTAKKKVCSQCGQRYKIGVL